MTLSHHISRLVFELTFPSKEKVAPGQNKLTDLVQNHLTAVLEKVLDKYDRQDVLTKIDTLEIDIDVIDLSAPETTIIRQIESQVDTQLNKLLDRPGSHGVYTRQISGKDVTVEQFTHADSQSGIELVIFILKNGHLPWWAKGNDLSVKLEQQTDELIRTSGVSFFKALNTKLRYINFRRRVIHLFSGEQLKWLLSTLHGKTVFSSTVFERIDSLGKSLKADVYEQLILAAIRQGHPINIQDIRSENHSAYFQELQKVAELLHLPINEFIGGANDRPTDDPTPATTSRKGKSEKSSPDTGLPDETSSHLPGKEDRSTNDPPHTTVNKAEKSKTSSPDSDFSGEPPLPLPGTEGRPTDDSPHEMVNGNEKSETRSPGTNVSNPLLFNQIDEDIVDGMTVQRAGLVLALPFLTAFFKELELFQDKQFVNEAAQHHAVYLLYHLATGSEELPDEHHLAFEKICCGLDVTDLLLPFKGFSAKEKEETTNLLLSILDAWKALKNSSPRAIQEAFLSREGYLKQQEDGSLKVHIERQTLDLLIDRIPWTISILRIPGSNEILYVEW